MSKTLKIADSHYSMDSIYVKTAVARLFQQRKMKNETIDSFMVRKNIINEGDLLLAMFEIEDSAKEAGMNLRTK